MDTIKYVVIGASGHHHQISDAVDAGLINPPCAVAAASPREDMVKLAALAGGKLYDDYKEMLEAEKPAVAVINPWYGYIAPVTEYCLKNGIHVYSEKPLAADFEQFESLKRTYEASGLDLGCMLNLNCCSWYKAIENAINDGEIGPVRFIHGQKSYRMGIRGEHYHKRSDYSGTIPWISIHAVDWVLRLGGRCQWVAASHTRIENRGNGEMESAAAVLLQLENGVIGTVDTDFLRPVGSARHDDDRLRVTGTKGMLEVIDGRVYLENDLPRRELVNPEGENPFIRFVKGIGTAQNRKLAEEAFEDTRICLLARQAADEGQVVSC